VFNDAHTMWTESRLTQARAAEVLGVCDRTFRRYPSRASPGRFHNVTLK